MYEPYSLLEARMEKMFEGLAKTTDPSINLVSTNIYDVLQNAHHVTPNNRIVAAMRICLKQSKNDIVHFLFDEVDAAYFTEENAKGLKNFIVEERCLDDAIIFSLQSTEKDQTFYDSLGKKHEVKTFFQDEKTGMVLLKPLTKSMRMVSNVYRLKSIAEDVIKQQSTKLALKEKQDSGESLPKHPSEAELKIPNFKTNSDQSSQIPLPIDQFPLQNNGVSPLSMLMQCT